MKAQMQNILNRLRWSMMQNNNEWVSASEMMWLLKEHTNPTVNKLYSESCNGKKLPVPTLRYLNNTNQLARSAKMSGEYEVTKGQNSRGSSVSMYRLQVTA